MKDNLNIPYGVADFKRIRNEGYYSIDKTGYIPLLQAEGNNSYRDITHGQGFYRAWFKMFKGSFDRIYMTGVSPVTMDDLTSGFNIATNISQDAAFNAMLGFSEEECLRLYTDLVRAEQIAEEAM